MTIAESLRNAFVTQGIAKDEIWCAYIVYYQDDEKTDLVLKLNKDNSVNMSEDEYWDLLSKYQVGDGLGNGLAVGSRVWTNGINGKRLFTFVDVDGYTYWECINPFPPTKLDPNHLWEI